MAVSGARTLACAPWLMQSDEAFVRPALAEPRERNTRVGTDSLRRIRRSREAARAAVQNHPLQPDRAFAARGMPDSRRCRRRSRTGLDGQLCPASSWSSAGEVFQRWRAGSSFARGFLNLTFFLPMPCASYQWSSASTSVPPGSRIAATPFIVRHRPRPYCRTRRRRLRTPGPAAIVSIDRISPTMSNVTSATRLPQRRIDFGDLSTFGNLT